MDQFRNNMATSYIYITYNTYFTVTSCILFYSGQLCFAFGFHSMILEPQCKYICEVSILIYLFTVEVDFTGKSKIIFTFHWILLRPLY